MMIEIQNTDGVPMWINTQHISLVRALTNSTCVAYLSNRIEIKIPTTVEKFILLINSLENGGG